MGMILSPSYAKTFKGRSWERYSLTHMQSFSRDCHGNDIVPIIRKDFHGTVMGMILSPSYANIFKDGHGNDIA